jgi:hypothetical protein
VMGAMTGFYSADEAGLLERPSSHRHRPAQVLANKRRSPVITTSLFTGSVGERSIKNSFMDCKRGRQKAFVVRADEKLTAFLHLESAIRVAARRELYKIGLASQFAPQSSQAEQSETKMRNCRA